MDEESGASLEPTPEQVRYAEVLEKGMLFGLLCLTVTFALYVFGIMEPYVPLEQLSQHWQKDVDQYLTEAKIEAGWSWVGMLKYGDFLNFSGIAVLAGVSVPCYLSIIPLLLRRKDAIYAVLAMLEVIVLIVAASGVVNVGH